MLPRFSDESGPYRPGKVASYPASSYPASRRGGLEGSVHPSPTSLHKGAVGAGSRHEALLFLLENRGIVLAGPGYRFRTNIYEL